MPRRLRFEVRERVDARGRIRVPLHLEDLDRVIEACRAEKVEAIAIQFLHSYAAPEHEARCEAYLRERLPGVGITASHEITREWREYERANTAVLNAYVQPIVQRYFDTLEAGLGALGLDCPMMAMQSNGGTTSFGWARAHPITLLESGPAAGVNGAALIGRLCGEPDVIYLDIGGTTAKCSTIEDGEPAVTTDYRLEATRIRYGYPVRVPVIDIVEIGAGGGSVAWFDESGALCVGPRSAGADPGPACYGRGGAEPTVTDAKLIAGVLNPANFAGGRLTLDIGLARAAMGGVGARAGLQRRRGGGRRDPPGRCQHDQRAQAGLHPARPRPARFRADGGRRRRRHARRQPRPRARREGDRGAAPSRPLLGLGNAGDRAPARLHAHRTPARRVPRYRRPARPLRRASRGGGPLLRRGRRARQRRRRLPHRHALRRPGARGDGPGRPRPDEPRVAARRVPRRPRARLYLPPRRHAGRTRHLPPQRHRRCRPAGA